MNIQLFNYPESSKLRRFGTLLFEEYRGQSTTIALKLCLQLFRHLRHRSLYILLPVFELMKKSHSCFAFFDNLGILKTPFTCLKWEAKIGGGFFKKYFEKIFSSHLFELGKAFCTPYFWFVYKKFVFVSLRTNYPFTYLHNRYKNGHPYLPKCKKVL